ncbi:MAG TPA: type I 3-dehydroquinate dehydratase, partial [Bacteroidaceae bacterium]|nr:type I 3-dehydroquinate dehydratase [Bacteroidaceae bacterium]
MICLSVQNKSQLSEMSGKWIELVELRLDLLKEPPARLIKAIDKNIKIIATCRPGNLPEGERINILKDSIKAGVNFIDVEIETDPDAIADLKKLSIQNGCKLILSWHDFKETPGKADLVSRMESCYRRGADIAKIACMVKGREDILNLMSLYALPGRKVVLGMGRMAGITRVAAPFLGAEFTYATTSRAEETAP